MALGGEAACSLAERPNHCLGLDHALLSLLFEWPWVFYAHIAPNPLHSEMHLSIITRLEGLFQLFHLWKAESVRMRL